MSDIFEFTVYANASDEVGTVTHTTTNWYDPLDSESVLMKIQSEFDQNGTYPEKVVFTRLVMESQPSRLFRDLPLKVI